MRERLENLFWWSVVWGGRSMLASGSGWVLWVMANHPWTFGVAAFAMCCAGAYIAFQFARGH